MSAPSPMTHSAGAAALTFIAATALEVFRPGFLLRAQWALNRAHRDGDLVAAGQTMLNHAHRDGELVAAGQTMLNRTHRGIS
jgi:hypothetical protein